MRTVAAFVEQVSVKLVCQLESIPIRGLFLRFPNFWSAEPHNEDVVFDFVLSRLQMGDAESETPSEKKTDPRPPGDDAEKVGGQRRSEQCMQNSKLLHSFPVHVESYCSGSRTRAARCGRFR